MKLFRRASTERALRGIRPSIFKSEILGEFGFREVRILMPLELSLYLSALAFRLRTALDLALFALPRGVFGSIRLRSSGVGLPPNCL